MIGPKIKATLQENVSNSLAGDKKKPQNNEGKSRVCGASPVRWEEPCLLQRANARTAVRLRRPFHSGFEIRFSFCNQVRFLLTSYLRAEVRAGAGRLVQEFWLVLPHALAFIRGNQCAGNARTTARANGRFGVGNSPVVQ